MQRNGILNRSLHADSPLITGHLGGAPSPMLPRRIYGVYPEHCAPSARTHHRLSPLINCESRISCRPAFRHTQASLFRLRLPRVSWYKTAYLRVCHPVPYRSLLFSYAKPRLNPQPMTPPSKTREHRDDLPLRPCPDAPAPLRCSIRPSHISGSIPDFRVSSSLPGATKLVLPWPYRQPVAWRSHAT